MKIADSVDDPEAYLYMTDDIIRTIERSKCPELSESRRIVKNIRTRNLYTFVDEFLVPPELEAHLNSSTLTAQDIANSQTDNAGLVERDIIVDFTKINYSMKESNPVDSIRFFSKFNDQGNFFIYKKKPCASVDSFFYIYILVESFNISKQKVSYMIPSKFQDINIRIFTRTPSKMKAIQKAFRRLLGQITHDDVNVNPTVCVPDDYPTTKRRRSSS